MRWRGEISGEVNIAYYSDHSEIYVNCDEGRIRRPLALVREGKPLLKARHVRNIQQGRWQWSDLIREGIIEYIDAEEEETAYAVAVITIFGLLATLIYPYVSYLIFQGNPIQMQKNSRQHPRLTAHLC